MQFEGAAVKLVDAVTAAGYSDVLSFRRPSRVVGIQVVSATSAAVVAVVEGTLNGSDFSTLMTWDASAPRANGDIIYAVDLPVAGVRVHVTTITGITIAAPTVALHVDSTAAQVDAGTHVYAFTQNKPVSAASKETSIGSTSATLTADGTHTSIDVTVPALTGDVTSYNIYRSKAGVTAPTNSQWFLVASAQAPGTYNDKIPDASLGANPPVPKVSAFVIAGGEK